MLERKCKAITVYLFRIADVVYIINANYNNRNKKFSYRIDSARCKISHLRSLKVVICWTNRRGIYEFLLALNSRPNLTSIFNCSWDITPSFFIQPHLFFQVELEKYGWVLVDMLWCQGVQNIGLSSHKVKSVLTCTIWSQCTPVPYRQTDGRTDGRTSWQ